MLTLYSQRLQETQIEICLLVTLFLDLATQNIMYIQVYNNMHLSSFRIFLCNRSLQVTDIHKQRCRVFLEVVTDIYLAGIIIACV